MILIGTSGWQYRHWRGPYFRAGTPQSRWFEQVLHDFRTVELNVTFYRLPKVEVFAGWYERSPADAVLTVKASRFITHVKRLRDPGPSVEMLLTRAAPLREKQGPVLVQLPPNLQLDAAALAATLDCFPPGMRVAVETRHPSWIVPQVRSLLESYGAAWVWADRYGPLPPTWRTADWGYIRLHEGSGDPWPFYTREEIAAWADRIAEAYGAGDAYVYFNNDPGCAAVDDAVTLAELLAERGVAATRVPAVRPDVARA